MAQDISANNKRIAKNTIMLFLRTLLIMAISLYTSRVLLSTLGIEDYGLYNVIGGVVVIFGSITASLSGASSRFITFELGKVDSDNTKLKKTFSAILSIHYLLALFILLLGETGGLWFVCNKLVIPEPRFYAAMWVYQCTLIATVLSIISIPYNALIIAHEEMSAFAYISLIECTLKLLVLYLIAVLPFDNLIIYAILIACIQLLIRLIYTAYSKRKFEESRTKLSYDKTIFAEVGKFAAWTFGGNLAYVGFTQGINILLNIFFGPVVNAARGISVQVQSSCLSIVSNFQTAVKPQITKSYASGDLERMHSLICMSSKYGFYLLLILVFTLEMLLVPILNIWLVEIPDHTASLCAILLLVTLSDPLKVPILAAIHATGDIKKFQTIESLCLLSILPVAYFALKVFCITPELVIVIYLVIEYITQYIRMSIALPKVNLSIWSYTKRVLLKLLLPVAVLAATVYCFRIDSPLTIVYLICYAAICSLYALVVVAFIGLSKAERSRFINMALAKIIH